MGEDEVAGVGSCAAAAAPALRVPGMAPDMVARLLVVVGCEVMRRRESVLTSLQNKISWMHKHS